MPLYYRILFIFLSVFIFSAHTMKLFSRQNDNILASYNTSNFSYPRNEVLSMPLLEGEAFYSNETHNASELAATGEIIFAPMPGGEVPGSPISKPSITSVGYCNKMLNTDLVKVRFLFTAAEPTSSEAFKNAETQYSEATTAINQLGVQNITLTDIGSTLTLNPVDNSTFFVVQKFLEISTRDENTAFKLIDMAVKINPVLIQSITYDISDELEEEAVKECTDKAIQNAKMGIKAIAAAEKLNVDFSRDMISTNLASTFIEYVISNNPAVIPARQLHLTVNVSYMSSVPKNQR